MKDDVLKIFRFQTFYMDDIAVISKNVNEKISDFKKIMGR